MIGFLILLVVMLTIVYIMNIQASWNTTGRDASFLTASIMYVIILLLSTIIYVQGGLIKEEAQKFEGSYEQTI